MNFPSHQETNASVGVRPRRVHRIGSSIRMALLAVISAIAVGSALPSTDAVAQDNATDSGPALFLAIKAGGKTVNVECASTQTGQQCADALEPYLKLMSSPTNAALPKTGSEPSTFTRIKAGGKTVNVECAASQTAQQCVDGLTRYLRLME